MKLKLAGAAVGALMLAMAVPAAADNEDDTSLEDQQDGGGLAPSGADWETSLQREPDAPLDGIVEATRYVESGQKTGSVVIRVSEAVSSEQPGAAAPQEVEPPA